MKTLIEINFDKRFLRLDGNTMGEVITLKDKKEKKPIQTQGFADVAVPMDCMDMVNMYGTYNIQPTSEHAHEYPAIAQGLSAKADAENRKARDRWKQQQAQKETR